MVMVTGQLPTRIPFFKGGRREKGGEEGTCKHGIFLVLH